MALPPATALMNEQSGTSCIAGTLHRTTDSAPSATSSAPQPYPLHCIACMLPPLQAGVWRPKGNLGPGSEAGAFLKRPGSGSEHSGPVSAPSKEPARVRTGARCSAYYSMPLPRFLRGVVPCAAGAAHHEDESWLSLKRLLEWRPPDRSGRCKDERLERAAATSRGVPMGGRARRN